MTIESQYDMKRLCSNEEDVGKFYNWYIYDYWILIPKSRDCDPYVQHSSALRPRILCFQIGYTLLQ